MVSLYNLLSILLSYLKFRSCSEEEGGGHTTCLSSQSQNSPVTLTNAKDKDWLDGYPHLMDILKKVKPSQFYTAGDVVPEQIANEAFDKCLSFL